MMGGEDETTTVGREDNDDDGQFFLLFFLFNSSLLALSFNQLGVDSALTRPRQPESRPSRSKLEAQGDSRLCLVAVPAESEMTQSIL